MKPLFLLVGESGCGKSTLADACEKEGFSVVQSYTTRKPRYEGERGHIFVSESDMPNKDEMAAYTYFDGNHYWTTLEQLENSDIYIIDPAGVEFMKNVNLNSRKTCVIYIYAPEGVRKRRMKNRGDDDKSIEKRIKNDRIEFAHFLKTRNYDRSYVNVNMETGENRPVEKFVHYIKKLQRTMR